MDKKMKVMSIVGYIFLLFIGIVNTKCTISQGWTELSMEERLLMSETVVYGKTKEHRANVKKIKGKSYYEIDAVFEVYCVLERGEEPTEETIIIEKIAPRNGCSGTRDHLKIGEEAIIALKMTSDGKYEYDEVMPTQSASFAATKSNFYSISSVCNLQSWSAPANASMNKCPVCGITNFTDAVMDSAENKQIKPCFVDGVRISNDTNCNLFATNNIDSASTCISADFDLTCARMLYSIPSVNCECTSTPDKPKNLDLEQIDDGFLALPSVLTMMICLIAFFLSA